MSSKKPSDNSMIRVHIVGASVCLLIAGGAVWFAADSISRRRGLFLSARHELTSVREELNQSVSKRTSLSSRVSELKDATSKSLKLESSKRLNQRTADISRLAESEQISIDTLQPQEMIRDARVPVQPLELEGFARADDVSAFLAHLGARMPDMHIEQIELTSESLGSDRVRLRLLLYWFVDPAGES